MKTTVNVSGKSVVRWTKAVSSHLPSTRHFGDGIAAARYGLVLVALAVVTTGQTV